MLELRLWGRCRIYHDPVSPVLKGKAAIGWEAMYRKIDLVIERRLKGEELARRMKGWWTVEPRPVIETVERHGRLVLGERGELLVQVEDAETAERLKQDLAEAFGDQVLLRP